MTEENSLMSLSLNFTDQRGNAIFQLQSKTNATRKHQPTTARVLDFGLLPSLLGL